MPRQLTLPALTALLSQTTGKVLLITLEITGAGIATPIRLVNDLLDHTIGGNLFSAFPFDVILPSDDADKPPIAKIRVSNVSQLLVDEIRLLPQPPTFELAIRLSDSLDDIEYGPWQLDASSASYDNATIEIDLRMRDFTVEPFPYIRMSPNYYPGLFRR